MDGRTGKPACGPTDGHGTTFFKTTRDWFLSGRDGMSLETMADNYHSDCSENSNNQCRKDRSSVTTMFSNSFDAFCKCSLHAGMHIEII